MQPQVNLQNIATNKKQRKWLKETLMMSMAYRGVDTLKIMLTLEHLGLLEIK